MTESAISARYETPHPNAPIDLYQGLLRLSWGDETVEGQGSIHLDRQPSPRLAFTIELPFDPEMLIDASLPEVTIEMMEAAGKGRGLILGSTMEIEMGVSMQRTITGVIKGDFLIGNPTATDTVIFHVPNFPRYMGTTIESKGAVWTGRLSASTTQWHVEVDSLRNDDRLWEELNVRGGYCITHVGRVQRPNAVPVAFEDVDHLLEILYWWLALLRSERTGPVLVAGVHHDEVIWEIWRTPSIAPWMGWRSWLPQVLFQPSPETTAVDVGPVLQALTDAFADSDQKRSLERAIDWYTQSVQAAHLATTVIFAQAGLELMSWMRLVGDGIIGEEAFKRLDAADALRLSLELTSIVLGVPVEAANLFAVTRRQSGGVPELDGPGSVVEIRNGTIHPKPRQRLAGDTAMFQGGLLAIRYLELLLLHRLDYSGSSFNRVTGGHPEPVPWA